MHLMESDDPEYVIWVCRSDNHEWVMWGGSHKNSVDVLRRCLNSIPQRDDLHVIVIDDNSDPKIVDFDKFPGKERADVTLIFDKESKGAGHARNRGLELLDTKWVLFSDCDDFHLFHFHQE